MRPKILLFVVLIAISRGVSANDSTDKARKTSESIRQVAVAWLAFATDYNAYLPSAIPNVVASSGRVGPASIRWSNYLSVSYEALRKALVPTYLNELPRFDAWGSPLEFAVNVENSQAVEYAIRSLGADRKEDDSGLYVPGPQEAQGADLVHTEGQFQIYPAELTRTNQPTLEELNALKPGERVVRLLEATGLSYYKVRDNVWSLEFQGTHTSSVTVVAAVVEDLVVVFTNIVSTKNITTSREMLTALLRFNDDYDGVKVVMDDDNVMIRFDAHARTLDVPEWEYVLNQVASGADELVKILTPYRKSRGT